MSEFSSTLYTILVIKRITHSTDKCSHCAHILKDTKYFIFCFCFCLPHPKIQIKPKYVLQINGNFLTKRLTYLSQQMNVLCFGSIGTKCKYLTWTAYWLKLFSLWWLEILKDLTLIWKSLWKIFIILLYLCENASN